MVKPPRGASGGLPRTGHFTFTRPAEPGDYCILLTPAQDANLERLRRHQMDLQMLFGGRLPEPTHLTCNRFEVPGKKNLDLLQKNLLHRLSKIAPFTLKPIAYIPQYSPLRFAHILKWQVEEDHNLRNLHSLIEDALDASGSTSMYPRGWLSTLVTALEEVQPIKLDPHTISIPLCDPLFTVGEVLITHIRGKNDFQPVAWIPLTGTS
jgi:hypothetical protein